MSRAVPKFIGPRLEVNPFQASTAPRPSLFCEGSNLRIVSSVIGPDSAAREAARLSAQQDAGRSGRNRGHRFEKDLARDIPLVLTEELPNRGPERRHLVTGKPAEELLAYISNAEGLRDIRFVRAWWTGGLATSGLGDRLIGAGKEAVNRTKSDVVVEIGHGEGERLVGIGVKTCFNAKPTNAQLYFGTATSFCRLLRENSLAVSDEMETELRKFCGDAGYRPKDSTSGDISRKSDPSRWYWEELQPKPRRHWEELFTDANAEVARALLQKAYNDDPIEPSYLLHLRHATELPDDWPLAIYSIDEFVNYNVLEGGFSTREYIIRKGRFKDDPSIHLAPRFGVIQFQRGGQRQHPTQLQFNLKAGYFHDFPSAPTALRE